MRKALLTSVVAIGLMTPAYGYAQPAPAASPRAEQASTFDATQWLTIGAIAVVGVVVLDALVPDEAVYLVVAGVGGYLATVWYNGGQVEIRSGAAPKR